MSNDRRVYHILFICFLCICLSCLAMKRTYNGNHSQGNNSNWCPPNNPQHQHGYRGNTVLPPPLALTHHGQSCTGQPSQPQYQGHSMVTQNVTGQPSQPQYQGHSTVKQNSTGQPSHPQYQAHSMVTQDVTRQPSHPQYQAHSMVTQDVTRQPSQPQYQGHSTVKQNSTGQPSHPQYQAHSMVTQDVTRQPSHPQYQAHSMVTQNVTGQPSQPQYQGHSTVKQNSTGQPSHPQYQAHSMVTQDVTRQPSHPQYQAHSMVTQDVTRQPSQPQYQGHSTVKQNSTGQPSHPQYQAHSMVTQDVTRQPSHPQYQAHSMVTQNVTGQPSQPQYQGHSTVKQNSTGQPSHPQYQAHSMVTQDVTRQPSHPQYQAHSMVTQDVTRQPSQPQYQGHSTRTQDVTRQFVPRHQQSHHTGMSNLSAHMQCPGNYTGSLHPAGLSSQAPHSALTQQSNTRHVLGPSPHHLSQSGPAVQVVAPCQSAARHHPRTAQSQVHQQPSVNTQSHVHHQPSVNTQSHVHQQPSVNTQSHVHHPSVNTQSHVHQQPSVNTQSHVHQQPSVNTQSHVHHQSSVNTQSQVHHQPTVNTQSQGQQQPSVNTQSQGQQQTMSPAGNQLLTQVPSQRQYASVTVTTSSSNSASQNQISSCGTGAYLSSSMFTSPGYQSLTSTTGPVDLSGGSASSHNQHSTNPATLATSASQSQPAPGQSKSHQVPVPSLGSCQNLIQESQDFWLQCIKEWYPDRDKKTYFLPPQFFRRTHHEVETMSGLSVLVHKPTPKVPKQGPALFYPTLTSQTQSSQFLLSPAQPSRNLPTSSQSNQVQSNQIQSNQIQSNQIQPTPNVAGSVFTLPQGDPAPLPHYIETDVLDDDAAERLWRCLQVLSKKHHEVMMVISQLDFRKYLDNDTDPISTAACTNLPRPVTMQQQQHHDGDFDVLFIHRHYGLMVCEVKAVGADRRNTPDLNKAVVGKVQKAVKQLNKAKTVLNHLVSDMVPVRVTKTLVLPNVTSAELVLALSNSYNLQQDLSTVDRLHQTLVTACRLKQALSSVPSLQSACTSCDVLQRELCKADTLKKELDRACQLQQELNIACRLQHDLTIINKIQQELATVCKLQEELSNVCQLQQDLSNISQLQKELTTACNLQTNLSTTSQLQATPGSDAQREHVKSTASELGQVLSTILQQLKKLGKGSQLHKAVGKTAQLQQVLNNISQLQQELSNTSQQQQSLSATSQLHLLLTNTSRLYTSLNTALQTQQNTGSVSQLEELLDTAWDLGWGRGDAAQLQRTLCTASCLPETLSCVTKLQQELNGVSQLQQSTSNASELLKQELDLTNTIQQALRADHRLQRAPETTDELQAALSSVCQLRQELMTTSQLQQELDIVSRLQHKLCMASQTLQAPSGSLLTRPELSILSQLHQALDTAGQTLQQLFTACQQGQLGQDLCTCLDAKDISEVITRCLCADQVPSDADLESLCNQGDSPGEPNQSTSGASTSSSQTSASPTFPLLSSWWQNMTSQGAGPDPHMSDTVYDKLLARFCGPATTVEVPTVTAPRKAMAKPGKYTPARKVVRTEGEAVAETGLIHSLLALYPDQVDLLGDNTLRCVHLRGPPGTGKTIVLVLKAIQWLHQGHDVHVVSMTKESRAVSILIERQLQCVLGPNPAPGFGVVHRYVVEASYSYTDNVNKLAALASDGELYVIADEVYGTLYLSTHKFERFINELHPKIPSLSVWCASVHKLYSPPSWMCERQLTTPLRSPPTVTKEVAKSKEMKESGIPSYSSTPAPAATEGPPVRWLPHKSGQDGHGKGTAMNCSACGDAVVQLLKELGVGQSSGPDSLQYRDVLVLGPSRRVKSKGNNSKRAEKGLTGKLLDSGIPLQILTQGDKDTKLRDVALGLKNEVTVSNYEIVSGLERRVVIGTGSSSDQAYLQSRLLAMSRCTAQLAWIGAIPQK